MITRDSISPELLVHMDFYSNDLWQRREIIDCSFCEYYGKWDYFQFIELVSNAVPQEYRHLASVKMDDPGYNSSTSLVVEYPRMETDKEMEARVDRALDYARDCVRRERITFDLLKAKFEGAS